MKKTIAFILLSFLISAIFAGCSQEIISSEGEFAPTTTAQADNTNYADEYLRIIEEYETTHGKGQEQGIEKFADGLYYARLVDFDFNDVPELVLGYIGKKDEYSALLYSIYSMKNGKAECADSGDMYTTGGPDPSIQYAYSDELVYFVTGMSQWATQRNYRCFNGDSFTTAFSHGGNLDGEYYVNDNPASSDVYESAVNSFKADIIKEDSIRLSSDYSITLATIEDTKNTLLKAK